MVLGPARNSPPLGGPRDLRCGGWGGGRLGDVVQEGGHGTQRQGQWWLGAEVAQKHDEGKNLGPVWGTGPCRPEGSAVV